MASERSLLQPLRSDSLRPRPSTQAVWEPVSPAAPPAPEPPVPSIHLQPLSDLPQPSEASVPLDALDLDTVIAAVITEEDDEDDLPEEPDAMPTEQMPEPACVPLYEEPSPARRRRAWPWVVLIIVLACGGYAAWHFGCLSLNWA